MSIGAIYVVPCVIGVSAMLLPQIFVWRFDDERAYPRFA